jgi:plasmid maintenance system antidote protein VapI
MASVPITGDIGLQLAHFFGTSAEFWLNLHSHYELRLVHQKAGNSIKDLPILKRSRAFTSQGISRFRDGAHAIVAVSS